MDKISILDDTFSSYIMKNDEKVFCKNLSSALSAFSDKIISVSIINVSRNAKEPFFGMRVFPSEKGMERICRRLSDHSPNASLTDMVNQWKHIQEWCIEIDSRTFDREVINFNPQELTAMVLHEIGHVIYSGKTIEAFYHAWKECQLHMRRDELAGDRVLYWIYQIPLSIACGFRKISLTPSDMREELFADTSVLKLGYGDHLVSAFQKIIKAYGSSCWSTNENDLNNTLLNSVTWCNLNIKDLIHRKEKLKDELYLMGAKTNSSVIRRFITRALNKLHVKEKEKFTGNVSLETTFDDIFDNENFAFESSLVYNIPELSKLTASIQSLQNTAKNEIANEAFGKKNKLKIPSQLDVDTIFVEVDRIENHADRRYVLDLIYEQEEKIENFKQYFEYNKDLKNKYAVKMEGMLRELESMRRAVLAKRNFDKQYKVFVKYPVGYEG